MWNHVQSLVEECLNSLVIYVFILAATATATAAFERSSELTLNTDVVPGYDTVLIRCYAMYLPIERVAF